MSETQGQATQPAGAGQVGVPRRAFWRCIWDLVKFRPWLYVAISLMLVLIYGVLPQVTGLITRDLFDSLTGDSALRLGPWSLSALLFGVALARSAIIFAGRIAHAVSRLTITL